MIATCRACGRVMAGTSCEPFAFRIRGVRYPRLRFGFDGLPSVARPDRCHDCGVTPGGYHHVGCALDVCQHDQASFCDECELELGRLPS